MKRIHMKSFTLLITVLLALTAALLPSCGSTVASDDLGRLTAERDSLRRVVSGVNARIVQIEARMAELDDVADLVAITALEVRALPFNHYFTVQGNIETDLNALVFAEAQGIVRSIHVREGQPVSKGQAILTIDTDLIQKNIDEVETQYTLVADLFERQSRLWEQKIGSEVQYLEAKSNKERLEGTLATLNKQKSMGTVKAPFDGVIDQITPKVGEMASPAMPIARIISLENLYARAQISENYINIVEPGMPAEIVLPGTDTVRTAVKRVGKFINPENRTFEVTFDIGEHKGVRPNMFCAIRINDQRLDSVVVIRSSMIMQDTENREFVYVVEQRNNESRVRKQFVEIGASYGDVSYIALGLQPGMLIVDRGARRVIDDQPVTVTATH